MAATPTALQLGLLQTVVDVASEKNSILVMPFPVEMLRCLDGASQPVSAAEIAATPTGPPGDTTPVPAQGSSRLPRFCPGAAAVLAGARQRKDSSTPYGHTRNRWLQRASSLANSSTVWRAAVATAPRGITLTGRVLPSSSGSDYGAQPRPWAPRIVLGAIEHVR